MSGFSQYRLLGILIEEFSEFLQKLFEGSEDEELSTKKIKDTLSQSELTIADITNNPISKLKEKLKRIDSETLDLIVVFLYETSQNGIKAKNVRENDFAELKSFEKLKPRIIELIDYLDLERKTFSLDRSNIKNSLLHLP